MYNVNEIIKFTPLPALIPPGHNIIAKLKQTRPRYENVEKFQESAFYKMQQ